MVKLVLMFEGKIVNYYFIEKFCVMIGCNVDNDIVIDDFLLSDIYVCIVCVGQDDIVEGLEICSGLCFNGKLLLCQIFQYCDIIEIGNYQLCYMSLCVVVDVDLDCIMLVQMLLCEVGIEVLVFGVLFLIVL